MIKWVHCQGFAPRISCVFPTFRSRFLWQQDGRHPHRCPSYRKGLDEKDSELWWFFWWLWYGGFACWFLHVFSDVHVFTPSNFLTKYWPLAVQGKNEVQLFQLTTRNMRNCWWLWTLRDFVALCGILIQAEPIKLRPSLQSRFQFQMSKPAEVVKYAFDGSLSRLKVWSQDF